LARVAESACSLYVQTVESELDRQGVELLVWAQDIATTTSTALELGNSLGALLAHHLRGAIDRQRFAQAGVTDRHLYRMAVGFVDLVGFTPLAQHAGVVELLDLIGRFEGRAFQAAALHGGRVVKHIGDEVMLVALDPASACAIARAITQVADDDGFEPRGGVAFGDVIGRHGDYYGPVVNLAARLADLAIPGEILVDETTAHAVESVEFSFRPAGRRLLKGFDTAIEVFSVVDAGRAERETPTSSGDVVGPPAQQED
jgi:adenylate cyclase